MKTLIVYKSKQGSTETYAKWLNEEIKDSDLYNIKTFNLSELFKYDRVIIGSSVYAGRISALDFLVKNWNVLKNTKVYLFTVGLAPADDKSSIESYYTIPEDIRAKIHYSKLPGRINPAKLNFIERFIVEKVVGRKLEELSSINLERADIEPIVEFMSHSN